MNGITPSSEIEEIERLVGLGLPPISSRTALATIFGVNSGLIWSLEKHPQHYYRSFFIAKGKSGKLRRIDAPRVALKVIQKWLSFHLEQAFLPSAHVYGFVQGRSHVDAAIIHRKSDWVFSVDIADYFQTTPEKMVKESMIRLGYQSESASIIAALTSLGGFLTQGAPSSPILSNICFQRMDINLLEMATHYHARMTRYADDIVFSGNGNFPFELAADIRQLFSNGVWKLSDKKIRLDISPNRLKVHGLLVHGADIRLTKGYRNKIRSYRHLISEGKIKEEDLPRIRGHLCYADFVQLKADLSNIYNESL